MPELERALRSVGRNLDYPATPDLSGSVRSRLQESERPRRPFQRRTLVIALAVLAVAVGAAMAVPQARSTILDWFGIGNVTIRYVEELPSSDLATEDLGLGERMSLEEARRHASFRVLVPTVEGLDDPPKVYWREDSVQVGFLYGSEKKPKLLITQAAGTGAIQKLAGLGTDIELVNVEPGTAGVWLSGDKHAFFYPSARPGHEEEPFRLVGNALVFETTGAVTIRLEAEISKDEAIRIARSLS